jgi:hypothetical protein
VGSRVGRTRTLYQKTLAERLEHGVWSVMKTPNVGERDILTGVSCATVNARVAVGTTTNMANSRLAPWC